MRRLLVLSLLLIAPSLAMAGPELLLQEGIELLNAGKVTAALEILHQAERQFPDRSRVAGILGEAYLRLGMQQLQGGDEAAARAAFANAKSYLPQDPRPWQGTAISWLHGGHPAAALGELHEALAIAGEQPELLLLLGRAHYAAGDLAQAEEVWQKVAELDEGGEATALLDKVRRERQAELNMTRDLAGRFPLAYAPGVGSDLADAVLEVLQEAYQDLGRNLGHYPDSDIPVLLYAREDFASITRSPEWAGAVYDGKIRVPLGGVRQMSPPLKALLYHEYAHVVARFLAKGRVPVWLNEGIAEVAGRRYDAPSGKTLSASGQTLAPEALDRPFSALPTELVPLAYQQSYERVSRLVDLCGWAPLGELLQRLGSGLSWDDAVARAYAPCGYDWPRLRVELGLAGE
jgi:tetratricopeptide (TPR) repeat protein